MYFKDFLLGLRRRWWVALIGLVLTTVLGVATALLVPVTYTTTTSLLMLPPRSTVGLKGNPYLNLEGLGQALSVLSARVTASGPARALALTHPDIDFSVAQDTTSAGPILLITSTSPSPIEAVQVRDDLVDLTPRVLLDMQNELSVQPSSRLTFSTLAEDPLPKKEIKGQLRAVIAIVAVAGGATLLGTGYLDQLLAVRGQLMGRRRRRRELQQGWWDTGAESEPTGLPPSGSDEALEVDRPTARLQEHLLAPANDVTDSGTDATRGPTAATAGAANDRGSLGPSTPDSKDLVSAVSGRHRGP
jgi:hypothetical protein